MSKMKVEGARGPIGQASCAGSTFAIADAEMPFDMGKGSAESVGPWIHHGSLDGDCSGAL